MEVGHLLGARHRIEVGHLLGARHRAGICACSWHLLS